MRLEEIGLEGNSSLVMDRRLVELTLVGKNVSKIVMCIGVVRFDC